ncbi:MAG TPA: chemotaxis response regulator protein-glutamate methylesterase [Longimicrobiaceae bacterium]|nr:chemotaxis response regulator protein-glutamate methylesterase [Longimicrobiaceae bacterium]
MTRTNQPIRVMVVDDSTVIRGLLARIIDAEPDLEVTASVANGRTAIEMLRLRPVDVVLLDVEMPEMDGLTALPLLRAARPGVRVVMASSLTQKGAETTLRALALGAADYVPKPSALSASRGMAAISAELVAKVRALGRAGESAPSAAVRPAAPDAPSFLAGGAGEAPRLIAVASSTGGPNALAQLLGPLPADFPLPTLVTQHMPPLFTGALADRLRRETRRPCREAVNGEPLEPGHTYVAPGDHHMTVMTSERRPVIRLDQSAPVNYCRPAADPMLASVARVFGSSALTVVLTGMGEDALAGCREMVRVGGRVLVQDEPSSVVWGMPGAVYRAGLASAALPLPELTERIRQFAATGDAA